MPDCKPPRDPFSGSGRLSQGGFLAVHKQDFNAHIGGTEGLRHCADQIDMAPPLNAPYTAPTVQETLELLGTIVSNAGDMYISIGNTTLAPNADFVVGDNATNLADAFTQALATTRLSNGGVIVIKAGTYDVASTISLPPGITVMGDPMGVTINATSVNSVFQVQAQASYSSLTAPTDFTFNKFYNLTIIDNFGLLVPLVHCKLGSYTIFDRVTFVGKVQVNQGTFRAISAFDTGSTTLNPTLGTQLYIENSYFDGFSTPIQFDAKRGNQDHFKVINCRVAGLGAPGGGDAVKAAILFNPCHAMISNNYILTYNSGSYACRNAIVINSTAVNDATNCRYTITGNSGGKVVVTPQDRIDFLIDSSSASTNYGGQCTGNTWGGSATTNNWYITVGDGNSSTGDIVGTNAIDKLIGATSIFGSSTNYLSDVTIIVNPGTYTVSGTQKSTSGVDAKFKLIGNPDYRSAFTLPVIELDATTLPNFGSFSGSKVLRSFQEIKNIYFKPSFFSSNFVYVSWSPDATGFDSVLQNATFENCMFYDCGLVVENNVSFEFRKRNVDIKNCRFSRSNTYAGYYSLSLPANVISQLNIEKCYFNGFDYALSVGSIPGSTHTGNDSFGNNYGQIVIRDTIFNEFSLSTSGSPDTGTSGYRITSKVQSSNFSSYILLNDGYTDVTVDNCTIRGVTEAFGVGLDSKNYNILDPSVKGATDADFNKWMRIYAKSIKVTNSQIFGPGDVYTTTFDGLAATANVVTMFLEPGTSLKVNNCDIKGGCPIQLSGPRFFAKQNGGVSGITTDIYGSSIVDISHNHIAGYNFENSYSPTIQSSTNILISIDATPYPHDQYGSTRPVIKINNNFIENPSVPAITTFVPMYNVQSYPLDFNNADGTYDAYSLYRHLAGVQINTIGYRVSFTNNDVYYNCWSADPINASSNPPISAAVGILSGSFSGYYLDITQTSDVSDACAIITGNNIKFKIGNYKANAFTSNSHVFTALASGSTTSVISNNTIRFDSEYSTANTDAKPFGCYIYYHGAPGVSTGTPPSVINDLVGGCTINNNFFGRTKNQVFPAPGGPQGNLNRAGIYVEADSTQGMILDNIFEYIDINLSGDPTMQIVVNASDWTINGNKNHFQEIFIPPNSCQNFITYRNNPSAVLTPTNFTTNAELLFLTLDEGANLGALGIHYANGANDQLEWIVDPLMYFDPYFLMTGAQVQYDWTTTAGWGVGSVVTLGAVGRQSGSSAGNVLVSTASSSSGTIQFSMSGQAAKNVVLKLTIAANNASGATRLLRFGGMRIFGSI